MNVITEVNQHDDSWTSIDYRKLGFKCGLEIHQQLKTAKKLFCNCLVRLRRDPPHAEILRHMRPTLSEMGTYDGTALMEFKKKKDVRYQLYKDGICTYEMDDTPPFPINEKALDIALEIALLLDCSLVDEVHVSRKQYLDGSIPTGFQRTAIIGVEGRIPFKDHEVGIIQLSIEEDACREVSDKGHQIVFKTDRLGTPLVEVVTKADLKDPAEVSECAEQIGRLMRATGKVRCGLGATRQDVNVSINGGTRIEIKGVAKLQWLEPLTRNEAIRQKALLEIRDILRSRGIAEATLQTEIRDLTHLFLNTKCPQIAKAIESGRIVKGIKLCGFGDLLPKEIMPGVTFSEEFAGRIKVIACIDEMPNIIHTDELPKYGITADERKKIEQEMRDRHFDVTVISWGSVTDVETAMKEIRLRAIDALNGVPSETRQAFPDGTTRFERILPGPDRMYPDTDSPPSPITEERIQRIKKTLIEKPWERERKYIDLGLPLCTAKQLSFSQRAMLFEKLVKEGFPAKATSFFLVEKMKALKREGFKDDKISDDMILSAFGFLRANGMSYNLLPELVSELCENIDIESAAKKLGLAPISDEEVENFASEIISRFTNEDERLFYIMRKFRRRVSIERVRKIITGIQNN